ncbi:MAG: hypothetical protein P8185_23555 [Deltaproteobacteria bacterium]|jgi:hypothetical protein
MTQNQKLKLSDIFDDKESHKTILKIGIVMVLSIELIIYLVANFRSGTHSYLEIFDSKGNKVYETKGNVLTTYEKLIFQNTYGPLSNYRIRVVNRNIPFPFRAWLAVAVGVPIGFMLLLTYLVRAYLSFVAGGEEQNTNDLESLNEDGGRFRHLFSWRRLSLFHFGFFVLVCVLTIWLVPNYVAEIARGAISLIVKYKWFFSGVFVFLASLLVWIIYLKYKISERMMDRRMDLEKFKVEKQLLLEKERRLALPDAAFEVKAKPGNAGDEHGAGSGRELETDKVSQSE